MTEVTFSVPQNDRMTMACTFNLAILLGHPITLQLGEKLEGENLLC